MKRFYIIVCIWVCAAAGVFAQAPYTGSPKVGFDDISKRDDKVNVSISIDVSGFDPGRNTMLIFTPVLRTADGSHRIELDQVVVTGQQRARSVSRENYFRKQPQVRLPEGTQSYVVSRWRNPGKIYIQHTLPYEKWMNRSEIVLIEEAVGCGNAHLLYAGGQSSILYREDVVWGGTFVPDFHVAYVTPPVEDIKIQDETFSARLQFMVNKSEIIPSYQDNARILDEADKIVERIKSDSLLTIRTITVRGYASPEGSEAANMRLSQSRADAFVRYLGDRHGFSVHDRMITAEGMGEDWAGLRKLVAESDIKDRDRVLSAIDDTSNPTSRKAAIKGLSGGKTYQNLLSTYYPPLRRNEYTISYEVRTFNPEEAAIIYRERPRLLSLNEMFMVANRYERGSDQFKEVFDIAARMYPESPLSQLNVAAAEIESGSFDTAARRLENMSTPEAYTNLGIAWWRKGEYEKAEAAFSKAVGKGCAVAEQNWAEFRQWLEDRVE